MPRRLSAACTIAVNCALDIDAPPAVPESPTWEVTVLPVPLTTQVTSGSTPAPRGRNFSILAVSAVTSAGLALTTMAFEDGIPSDRATESETTASTPAMPTVPNATTDSCSGWRPETVTLPPSGSRSSVPMP